MIKLYSKINCGLGPAEAFLIKTITHRFEIGPNRFCLNDKNCQYLYDRKTNTVIDCVRINK